MNWITDAVIFKRKEEIMKICFLDAYTMNPGDLSWADFHELGELVIHDRTAGQPISELAADAEIVLSNKQQLRAHHMDALPKLKYIGVTATGYDIIDVKAATERNIVVSNVPGYSTASVPQFVFAYILEWASRVFQHNQEVHAGAWAQSADFSFTSHPLVELDGLTIGIIGYGNIGKKVASIAKGFGMNVIVYTRTIPQVNEQNVQFVSLDHLISESDIITLHCPLTELTSQLINAERLRLMKRSAFLVNTGRGQLVDEKALADALSSGQIAGAGLDVLTMEPPESDNPLFNLDNCFITPHIAWATQAARKRMMTIVLENIKGYLAGDAVNQVN